MPDFTKRSVAKELLDDPAIPFIDIRKNMEELNRINSWLGGHAITLSGFKKLLGKSREVTVCEIGCGGGDNLFVILKWCRRYNVKVRLIGIDINPHCIAFARSRYETSDMTFICNDYRIVVFDDAMPDIIFCSLFCHHFADEALKEVVSWMGQNARAGFFINDLHRHPLAYYTIRWLTRWLSQSYLVKNDAPLSVLRGFSRQEWEQLFRACGIKASIRWRWAFRHLITYKKCRQQITILA